MFVSPLSPVLLRQLLLTASLVIWTVRFGSFSVQTHVLTRSSIKMGHMPPFGWLRDCLRTHYVCVS